MSSRSTDAARWKAVSTRDPSATSTFVYSVLTTKIYCRPNCPSRLARRANVIFFDCATDAAAAGFRACLRCRPDAPAAEDPRKDMVGRACGTIIAASRDGRELGLEDLAKEVGLTKRYFHRVFKGVTGLTPKAYREVLDQTTGNLLESGKVDGVGARLLEENGSADGTSGPTSSFGDVDMSAWIMDEMLVHDFVLYDDTT